MGYIVNAITKTPMPPYDNMSVVIKIANMTFCLPIFFTTAFAIVSDARLSCIIFPKIAPKTNMSIHEPAKFLNEFAKLTEKASHTFIRLVTITTNDETTATIVMCQPLKIIQTTSTTAKIIPIAPNIENLHCS